MLIFYDFGIKIYNFLIYIFQFFNSKAKQWIVGRKNIFQKIAETVDTREGSLWFHFASLGEFEQGRPVLEKMKSIQPGYKIVITFFSPSGYELRKNFSGADYIFYLPMDTARNAERFIELINPKLAIFTKYEYWYHYFHTLRQNNIPLYIISGIFRKEQAFFKWYGILNRRMLTMVSHFFVQDAGSQELLKSIGIKNSTVSGDTRFDRVAENAANPRMFEEIESFCAGKMVFVAGSTWPDDERLIAGLVKDYPGWKFIIAPHEIRDEKIESFISLLPAAAAIRHSQLKNQNIRADVLIIDNIGMLSSLYQYARIAYIGGGFGVGIHNTLEAAAFGSPVIFGPNYQKFLEAKALLKNGGGFTISTEQELKEIMAKLQDENFRARAAEAAGKFVQEQKGATEKIVEYIEKHDFQATADS